MSFRAAFIAGCAATMLATLPVCAQDRPIGIFLGYSFSDTLNPDAMYIPGEANQAQSTYGRMHQSGAILGVYVTQNRWLRWRADNSGTGLFSGAGYVMGGPEFTMRAPHTVFFAHALAGYGEIYGGVFGTNRTGFALGIGGGVDARLSSHWSVRVIDADYLPSHLSGPADGFLFASGSIPKITSWESNIRVSAGIIFKFGKKF